MIRRVIASAGAVVAAVLSVSPAAAATLVGDFAPVPVPSDWHVSKSIAASGTTIWGTGTTGDDARATVFRVDLEGGAPKAFPLGPEFGPDPIALAIVPGADSEAWFIGAELGPGPLPVPNGGAFLGEIASDGTLSMTPLFSGAFDNDLYPTIAFDPASRTVAWTQSGAPGGIPSIGWRSEAGAITEADFGAPGFPSAIAVGADGNFYFTDGWLYGIRIGQIAPGGTTATFLGQVTWPESTVGTGGGTPPLIVAGTGPDLWFTAPVLGQICRITTAGAVTPFSIVSTPFAFPSLAFGQDGSIYFASPDGKIDRLNPSSGEVDAFPLPASYDPVRLNLLVPSPISFAGDDAVLVAGFAGPGLLRLRGAGSPCPQVWNRTLPPIVVQTGAPFLQELGIPPNKPGPSSGMPPGVSVKSFPMVFGIFGAAAAPGTYAPSVTVIDAQQCAVDEFRLEIDAESRRIVPASRPDATTIERRP
ncbi:MAG TPA: hypothetical protein VFL12_07680 [Thermoanaerobaculia bacterium]|nr:hypothetical protein [Thermoanaerobaculia bacterium]